MEPININDKFYNPDSLTEQAKSLLNDIRHVNNEMSRLSIQTGIATIARNTLIEQLTIEVSELEEVPAPDQTDSQE